MTVSIQRLDYRPDLLWLHHAKPDHYPFLLESCVQGTPQARYDILFGLPQASLWLDHAGNLHADQGVPLAQGAQHFLEAVDYWQSQRATFNEAVQPDLPSEIPFSGGWFLYLGYELVGQTEPTVELAPADPTSVDAQFPVAFAVRCPAALIWDHETQQAYAVCEDNHADSLSALVADAAASESVASGQGVPELPAMGEIDEEDPSKFADSLAAIHEYILAGDVFQVNISRKWQVSEQADPASVYAALRRSNPAPFAGLARWRKSAVVSSSPERLVEVRDGVAQTRPIAGTRPRDDRQLDQLRRSELIGNPKERAEHIMLIDLERNDLGRVCQPGSVEVDELMVVESYAHVHHIVSNVRGQLRADATPGDVIRAVFPGGTITGCPKVRCMQIIAELEGQARGPYTGSMGYLNRDGSMDLNILIRSMLVEPSRITLRAGGGIVADSKIGRELNETRSKAKGMLLALASGNRGRSLLNGKISDAIDVSDRGLAYGDGVFETMVVRSGSPLLWRYHWARLQHASEVLALPLPDQATMLAQIAELCADVGSHVVKIILTRGSGGRGYQPPAQPSPNVLLQRFSMPNVGNGDAGASKVDSGLRVGVCRTRLGRQPQLAGIKHLSRIEQVLIQQELGERDWRDALVCDSEGLVIEAASANLFLVRQGQLYTPALDHCGVAGVYRAMLMDHLSVEKIELRPKQLNEFDGAFLCNAVRGIMPVAEVIGHAHFDLTKLTPVIEQAAEAYAQACEAAAC